MSDDCNDKLGADADYIAKLLADGKREVDIKRGEQKAWLANAFPSYAELLDCAADMKTTFEQTQTFIPNFMMESIEFGAKVQKKRQALKNVAAKLANDPKQKDKDFVRECWQAWQVNRANYKSNAAFALDMLEKCDNLESAKVIERWCTQWKKENAQPAS